MFRRSGRCVLCAAATRFPPDGEHVEEGHLAAAEGISHLTQCTRQSYDDAGKDDHAHPVANATLGNLLAQPHDEGRTGRERQDGEEPEHERTRVVDDLPGARGVRVLEAHDDEVTLDDREHDRGVSGPLVDLATTLLALFVEAVQGRNDHREQLKDDGRRDVRHHAEREDTEVFDRAARKHVEQPQEAVLLARDQLHHRLPVDTGQRAEHTDPVDREESEGEQDPSPELRDLEHVDERIHGLLRPRGPRRSPQPA